MWTITKSAFPKDVSGAPLKRIPFEFCGSDNNDAVPDVPVLYDIAVLNIGHYRNSADYEESCFIVGQPTPFFAGLDESWVKNVFKGKVQLGSRAAVPLPVGGSAGLLQAAPNIMPIEAMRHKEEQFLALGAKLVSPSGKVKTATEAGIDNVTETSVLSSLSANCSVAFQNALQNCMKFVSTNEDSEIVFTLNTDFEVSKMGVQERNQLLNEWMKGAISYTEYRNNLRGGKVEILEDEEAKKEIEDEIMNDFKIEESNPANQQTDNSVGK